MKSTGDGVLAVFQRAGWAVRASLKAHEALAQEEFAEVGKLAVRMVIVTGEADERDGDYFGSVLNEAARLLEECTGGQMLASAVTRAVVGDALPSGVGWRRVEASKSRSHQANQSPYELIRI